MLMICRVGQSKMCNPCWRDPVSWHPLAAGASSRNQGPTFETMPVDTFMGEKKRLACFAVRQS